MAKPTPQKAPLVFFRSGGGKEPVREWLKGWTQLTGWPSAKT
jgi:hypothetical protein